MSEFCRIEERWEMGGISLHIGTERDGMRTLRSGDGTWVSYRMDEPRRPDEYTPALTITDSEARALLQALANHYGSSDDARTLRKDYDAERARVDKLTDAVIALAAASSGVSS